MEATVTIKLTPAEFDTVRDALVAAQATAHAARQDNPAGPAREQARRDEVRFADLNTKLR